MKYAFDYDVEDIGKDDLPNFCTSTATVEKGDILAYMKSFEPVCYSTAYVVDIVEGKETEIDEVGFFDGEYMWYSQSIYYFEKYNLKLNDDFIAHVLSKMNE